MTQMRVQRRIEADVDRVFELFADFEHAADNVSGIVRMEMLTDGPVGVGAGLRGQAITRLDLAPNVPERDRAEAWRQAGGGHGGRDTSPGVQLGSGRKRRRV